MNFSELMNLGPKALGLYHLSTLEIFIRIFLAIAYGSLIAIVFVRTDKTNQNSNYSFLAIIFCPPIISCALMALGNSVTTAFGLFAALSIIRFRTPVKDIREMVYLFFSIAIGICVGVGAVKIASISLFIILIYLLLIHIYFEAKNYSGLYSLRIFLPTAEYEKHAIQINNFLSSQLSSFDLIEIRTPVSHLIEVIYRVKPKNLESIPHLLADIKSIEAVEDLIFQAPLLR